MSSTMPIFVITGLIRVGSGFEAENLLQGHLDSGSTLFSPLYFRALLEPLHEWPITADIMLKSSPK